MIKRQVIENILKKFPKHRTKLPADFKEIFQELYKENRSDSGFVGNLKARLENWMHIQVARLPKSKPLEVGAGTLNHLKFEAQLNSYDIIEPQPFLYDGKAEASMINHTYESSRDLPDDALYSNIFSIAVFEHMTNLPEELIFLSKHLEKKGVFQVAIPSEGALFWYIAWRFVTGFSFYLKHRRDYKIFMKYEHVNNCYEIESLIKYLFDDVKVVRFPFNLFHFSFYTYIEARHLNNDSLKELIALSANRENKKPG